MFLFVLAGIVDADCRPPRHLGREPHIVLAELPAGHLEAERHHTNRSGRARSTAPSTRRRPTARARCPRTGASLTIDVTERAIDRGHDHRLPVRNAWAIGLLPASGTEYSTDQPIDERVVCQDRHGRRRCRSRATPRATRSWTNRPSRGTPTAHRRSSSSLIAREDATAWLTSARKREPHSRLLDAVHARRSTGDSRSPGRPATAAACIHECSASVSCGGCSKPSRRIPMLRSPTESSSETHRALGHAPFDDTPSRRPGPRDRRARAAAPSVAAIAPVMPRARRARGQVVARSAVPRAATSRLSRWRSSVGDNSRRAIGGIVNRSRSVILGAIPGRSLGPTGGHPCLRPLVMGRWDQIRPGGLTAVTLCGNTDPRPHNGPRGGSIYRH